MADENVSLDEFLSNRKDYVKSGDIIMKATPQAGFETEIEGKKIRPAASWNKDKRTIRFVMSAEVEDRDRDIIVQAGIGLDEFLKNPQAFYNHNARGFPIGGWSDVEKVLSGRPKRTEGTLQVLPEGVEPDADRLARHFEAGSIRTASIGFIPKRVKRREKPADSKDEYGYWGYLIEEAELVECSAVSIPSNPAALAKMAADGDVVAREVIEEVLDLWARHPETGLIIPRAEFEAAYKEGMGNLTSITISHPTFKSPITVTSEDPETIQVVYGRVMAPNGTIIDSKAGKEGREAADPDEKPPVSPEPPPVSTGAETQKGEGNEPSKQKSPSAASADDPAPDPDPDPAPQQPLTEEQKDSLLTRLFKWFGSRSDDDIERELAAKRQRELEDAERRQTFEKRFQNLETRLGEKGLVD